MKWINLLKQHLELIMWSSALVFLWIMPFDNSTSACIFKFIGLTKCPGCGIGRSINLALHGHWTESVAMHPLGIIAIAIILYRIITLAFFNTNFKPTKQ